MIPKVPICSTIPRNRTLADSLTLRPSRYLLKHTHLHLRHSHLHHKPSLPKKPSLLKKPSLPKDNSQWPIFLVPTSTLSSTVLLNEFCNDLRSPTSSVDRLDHKDHKETPDVETV